MRMPVLLLTLALLWAMPVVEAAERMPRAIRIATSFPASDTSPAWTWVTTVVAELTGAGIQTRVHPGSTLGNEAERNDQLSLGLIEINLSSGLDVLHYSRELRTLRLPFLVNEQAELDCLLQQTDFLRRVNTHTRRRGVEVVDVVLAGGMARLMLRDGGVRVPSDLAGRRIRALDRIQILTVRSWGAAPVQVPWEEVQSALQTGIVDGYLNPPGVAVQFRHQRQIRQFLDLRVSSGLQFVTVSGRWWRELAKTERAAVERALSVARQQNRAHARRRAERDIEDLRAGGVQIWVPGPTEREKFRRQAMSIYPSIVDPSVAAAVTSDLQRCRASAPAGSML